MERGAWPDNPNQLILARITNKCTVLGPGVRAVIWVQGCPFRCPGCVAEDTLPFRGGEVVEVEALADELVSLLDLEGVTFSGGEPFSQAAALARLIDLVRAKSNLSFMSYSGNRIENLVKRGTPAQKALLQRLDILVDGLYVQERHTDLIWRGSDNQRVLLLSPRYRHLADQLDRRGNWIEFEMTGETVMWMGIPPQGFSDAFLQAMKHQEIS